MNRSLKEEFYTRSGETIHNSSKKTVVPADRYGESQSMARSSPTTVEFSSSRLAIFEGFNYNTHMDNGEGKQRGGNDTHLLSYPSLTSHLPSFLSFFLSLFSAFRIFTFFRHQSSTPPSPPAQAPAQSPKHKAQSLKRV